MSSQRMTTKKKTPEPAQKAKTPFLEWLLGGVGVVLLLSCITFLIYEGITSDEQPGAITASVKEILSAGDAYVVTFELHNAGSQTLSNVHLTARLTDGEREIERVQTVIDYLPGRSQQEGGFYFKHDPKNLDVEITPEGYQKP
jgi:uncharacterized protein (TIGR02588 family)